MLARSKLNTIERIIFQALICLETSHEKYKTIINEEEKYGILKEDIRLMKSQRSNAKKMHWRKKVKKIKISEIIRQNNENA